ncbi:MAG: polyprenyl synthetase family protein [Bacteroidia bacterium]|nr:polyprenyl synthetase family protein [Bacteroidia bacterium]
MNTTVEQLRREVELQLNRIGFSETPARLYDPVRYMLALGGKRMRPVLVLLANRMFGGNEQQAMPAALAVEVFHNFTLLHDDIMDKAPLRRGQATVHEKWNPDIAILSGDAMFVKSCQLMMASPSAAMPAVMNLFLQTALEVCEGQQLDMDFEHSAEVRIEEYLDMIRLKTAVLLGASLGIGAALAGASAEATGHVYDFGVNLGVAFQLQDDILDVYGDADKFGKQVGGDILANKKTFLLLTALEKAEGTLRDQLLYWLQEPASDEKVQGVKAVYAGLKVREAALTKMESLYQAALDHLEALPLSAEQTQPLRELAAMLMAREN